MPGCYIKHGSCMKKNIRDLLDDWPRNFIRDVDLVTLLDATDDARHSLVKRAVKARLLTRMKKGFYLIASHTKRVLPDEFVLAPLMYEPSIISLELALSYHGWIPEAVYTITCVSPRRGQQFKTPLGLFSYQHVPAQGFYEGVTRSESSTGIRCIAQPWRALADFIYVRRKTWPNAAHLEADLRIDYDTFMESDQALLQKLSEEYPSPRVRKMLRVFLMEMIHNKKRL